MSILSWNIRGAGNSKAHYELRDLIQCNKLEHIFLMETKASEEAMTRLSRQLGFEVCIAVDSEGLSGGFALFARQKLSITLLSKSRNHIDVEMINPPGRSWRLTGFYGEPNRCRREASWQLMRQLARENNLPWCMIGDFHAILCQAEKKGGNR